MAKGLSDNCPESPVLARRRGRSSKRDSHLADNNIFAVECFKDIGDTSGLHERGCA